MKKIMNKTITDIGSLKKVFDDLMKDGAIFRGISNRKQLLPKIIRNDKDCSLEEIKILKMFEQYYGIYTTANNCWEFLALAQHCGLMTRLIDFTYNPYVALFFSLHDKIEDGNYEVWIIRKKNIEPLFDSYSSPFQMDSKTGTLSIDDEAFRNRFDFSMELKHQFGELKKESGIITIRPKYRNSRMLMQQGLFVVPTKVNEKSIIKKFEDKAESIIIDKSIRDEALEYLDKLGFNEFHLMPDLDSLCYEINHVFIEGRKVK